MVRLLPFIIIPVLLLAGLWYWRSQAKPGLVAPQANKELPVEVPKTLPGASLDDRVKSLEDNNLPSSPLPTASSNPLDPRVTSLEASLQELKIRVSSLEKATPPVVSGKSTLYIPLGAGGSWSDVDWNSLSEYEISLNPDNYPGYTGMSLEVNFRLAEAAGTGSVRLYNTTDKNAVSSELNTTSTAFVLQTSSSFKLSTGTKTYRLQVKSTQRKELFIQSARIKVTF